jgi:hypothetical protein
MNAKLIALAAAIEVATGLVLIIDPSLVASLLLKADLNVVGQAVGRVAGFGLLGLGLACWPGREPARGNGAVRGLLAYNALAAIFFIYLGVRGELVGLLLWPAAVLHAALAILLARVFALQMAAHN